MSLGMPFGFNESRCAIVLQSKLDEDFEVLHCVMDVDLEPGRG